MTDALATWPRWPWVAAGIVFVLLVAWLAHGYGRSSATQDAAADATRRQVLEEQVTQLAAENRRLNARVAELEMARRLDRDAYGEIERTLGDLQSRLARQSDDLAFYRSIVSPADGVQGLRIQRFEVAPGTGPREFHLELTLVQAMRHESVVSGLVQVTIAGSQAGVPRKYTVGELLGQPRAQLPFSLRYFQTIEQLVSLPEGFDPHETRVRLQSSKLSGGPIEQAFPWKIRDRVPPEEKSVPGTTLED